MKKIIVLFVLLGLLLSACGGGTAPAQPADGDEAAPAEKVTVRFWSHQNDSFNAGYQALAEKYMSDHPNVEIVFETFDYDTYIQTLQTALPAGTEADILQMFGSWVCSYAEGGNLAVVPDNVISMEDAQAQILPAPVGGYICSNQLYGIPEEYNIEYGAVMVNTAIADAVGATGYKDGWADWDEVIADGQKMAAVQDGVMTRAGLNFTGSDGVATMFHSLYLQYGGEYLKDGVYTVDTEIGLKSLALMKQLVDEGLCDPLLYNDEENWVGDSYFGETSAMGLVGPWAIPEYSEDFPEVAANTIYVRLPSVGDEPVFAADSGWGLTVSANSKVKDVAWDFIKYVTLDPDNAVSWNLASGTLPALKENITGTNAENLIAEFPYFEPFLGILDYGVFAGHFPDRDFAWYEVAYPEGINFLQGNATAEETLQNMQSAIRDSFE